MPKPDLMSDDFLAALDEWLLYQFMHVGGRKIVTLREAMLDVAEQDREWWPNQSLWSLYDAENGKSIAI